MIPFLAALTNSESLLRNDSLKEIYQFVGISNQNQLIFWMTILFCLAVIFTTLIRITNIWATAKITAAVGSDLSSKAYSNTLYQPYNYHINKNSSELIAALTIQTNITVAILGSVLAMGSALIMLTSILLTLFLIDKWVTLFLITMISFFIS